MAEMMMKKMKENCHLLTTALLTRGRGKNTCPSIQPQPPPPSALYLYTILFLLINIVGVSEVSQDKFEDAFKNMLPVTYVSIRMTLPLEDSQRFVACDSCQ